MWGVCGFFLPSLTDPFCSLLDMGPPGFPSFHWASSWLHFSAVPWVVLQFVLLFSVIVRLRLPLPWRLLVQHFSSGALLTLLHFSSFSSFPPRCGSLSFAWRLFSLFLAPPLFRCSCCVSSGCTFLVMSPWRFSSLPLLPPLFYRPRFASATVVALAGHLFLVAFLPSPLVRCAVPFDTFFLLICSFLFGGCYVLVLLFAWVSCCSLRILLPWFAFQLGFLFFPRLFFRMYLYLWGFSFAFASLYLRRFRSFGVFAPSALFLTSCGYFSSRSSSSSFHIFFFFSYQGIHSRWF